MLYMVALVTGLFGMSVFAGYGIADACISEDAWWPGAVGFVAAVLLSIGLSGLIVS